MTLLQWLESNTEFEEAIFVDVNGNDCLFWYDNDDKYSSHVLKVEAINCFTAKVYTDYKGV